MSVLYPEIYSRILKLLSIENDGDLVCQSGARWEDINVALKEKGIPLFFPVSSEAYIRSKLIR